MADVPHDALNSAAANLAHWHATSVEALGCRSVWWPGGWASRGATPPLYLKAVIFSDSSTVAEHLQRLRVLAEEPKEQSVVVLDGTSLLDLRPLGLQREEPKPCFWRPASTPPAPPPPADLEFVEVTDENRLAEFEATSGVGFGVTTVPRFGWHAPGVLRNPRFRAWIGRVHGRSVGAAMAYVGNEVIGIYGVTVVPAARRHGYGTALTWHATKVAAVLPATLQPSDMAMGVYERMGYAPIGSFTVWHRPTD